MRETHGALRVVIANCLVEQDHLAGSIVCQRGENLAHELFVIEGDLAELPEVQDGIFVGYVHDLIVCVRGVGNNWRNTLVDRGRRH